MSWSFAVIGKASKVVEALKAESTRLTGQPKIEFDGALPSLVALVGENFAEEEEPTIRLEASGMGLAKDDKQVRRSCSVRVEQMHTRLV